MVVFLFYLLKVSVCLVLFYLFYKASLSNDTFFRFNRNILLTGMVLCFLLPLIQLPTEQISVVQVPFVAIENSLNGLQSQPVYVSESTIFRHESTIVDTKPLFSVSIINVLCFLYFFGFFVHFAFLFKSYLAMWRIFKNPTRVMRDGCILIILDHEIAPFSWYKYIVISSEDYKSHSEEILTHEMAHIRHRHSVDLILSELFILFQWFNPAIWLLNKELRNVHEYQADMSVLETGIDATRYQLLLVKKAVGSGSYTLANSFNHSKLKKRITMMLKEKSNKKARWKAWLFLPLGAIALQAFAQTSTKEDAVASLAAAPSVAPVAIVNQDKGTILISSDQKEKVEYYYVSIQENIKNNHEKLIKVSKVTRLTPTEYETFLSKTVRNFSDEKEALEFNGKFAVSFLKEQKGHEKQSVIVGYHILSDEQMETFMKKKNVPPPPPPPMQ